jgi:hypothetical protein
MLRLMLILTVVSLIAVPLLLGLAAVWTFFGVMLAGNGIMGVPEWPMAVYVVFALGLEWLCVSVVNVAGGGHPRAASADGSGARVCDLCAALEVARSDGECGGVARQRV